MDEKELKDKGQGERFNFNTGEAAAIKNEAVSGYVDIYSTPTTIAQIPLKNVPEPMRSMYEAVLAEEFTTMDKANDSAFPTFLQILFLASALVVLITNTYVSAGLLQNSTNAYKAKPSLLPLDEHPAIPKNLFFPPSPIALRIILFVHLFHTTLLTLPSQLNAKSTTFLK